MNYRGHLQDFRDSASDHAILRLSLQEGYDVIHDASVQQFHALRRLISVVRRQHHLLARQEMVTNGDSIAFPPKRADTT